MRPEYEVIVIGGGHAGTEAAWAAANALPRAGDSLAAVALITMDPSKIGAMSCNPAIGGLAKGQMVREIDALGGLMALATDATGIQFRVLNRSKGPAVRGPRAQCDKYAYAAEVQRLISTCAGIDIIAGTVDELLVESGRIIGVRLPVGSGIVRPIHQPVHLNGERAHPIYPAKPHARDQATGANTIHSRAVVLTTGTFMRGLMHTGEAKTEGGRIDEGSAIGISGMLRGLSFELGRLKTGTPPRLAAESIDWSALDPQEGDKSPVPFSDLSPQALPGGRFPLLPQVACHATHTTAEAHEIIRANLHRAPMYSGQIDAESGPRYCPSIEDKVVRFADRDSHHVFLEPESLHTNEIYCNGISTSLPRDVQEAIVHAMPGCARARILRFGYAVEYDMVRPHQIDATCMTKRIDGLFLAGQINGTSGYEEAAGQGVIAGLNAARFATGVEPVRFGRDEAYLGVMMDDLVTKTPREPYRMFTSRAEYRLLLRSDNADLRLTPRGRELGLVDDRRWGQFVERRDRMNTLHAALSSTRVNGKTALDHCRHPNVTVEEIAEILRGSDDARLGRSNGDAVRNGHGSGCDSALLERVMIDIQYEGYITRQRAEIKRRRATEGQHIPPGLSFTSIAGLRAEAAEALEKFQPATMGQAGRLAGVTPADLTLLAVAIKRFHAQESALDPVV